MKRKNSFKEYKPLTDKLVEIVDNSLLCQHWLVGLMKGEKDIKIKAVEKEIYRVKGQIDKLYR